MFKLAATNNYDTFYMYLIMAAIMLLMTIGSAVYYHFKNKK